MIEIARVKRLESGTGLSRTSDEIHIHVAADVRRSQAALNHLCCSSDSVANGLPAFISQGADLSASCRSVGGTRCQAGEQMAISGSTKRQYESRHQESLYADPLAPSSCVGCDSN